MAETTENGSGLSFDTARCAGTTADVCRHCRRREPGRDTWQTWIAPAITFGSRGQWCPNRIGVEYAPVLTNGTAIPNVLIHRPRSGLVK